MTFKILTQTPVCMETSSVRKRIFNLVAFLEQFGWNARIMTTHICFIALTLV